MSNDAIFWLAMLTDVGFLCALGFFWRWNDRADETLSREANRLDVRISTLRARIDETADARRHDEQRSSSLDDEIGCLRRRISALEETAYAGGLVDPEPPRAISIDGVNLR